MKLDAGQKMKPDAGHILINFSDGYIKCKLCGAKWEITGRNFGLDNRNEIEKFKEKHKNCLMPL
ncbi:MAG: hypothetical protein NT175_14135 [Bacteroidetes bacterium]|nr:hypothetical protein [Bacteroidota bacterium]